MIKLKNILWAVIRRFKWGIKFEHKINSKLLHLDLEWWLNPKHCWTFFIQISGWVDSEDHRDFLRGTIHVLCLVIRYTYWGWPLKRRSIKGDMK